VYSAYSGWISSEGRAWAEKVLGGAKKARDNYDSVVGSVIRAVVTVDKVLIGFGIAFNKFPTRSWKMCL